MKQPLVSIIIPNYNYGHFVGEAVESALTQTYVHIETIVVDDGSTDNSIEVLRNFGEKITLIAQKNAGVAVARNRGIQASNGEFVAFLDSDDSWLPEKIEKQIRRFQEDPSIGLVHCGYVVFDASSRVVEHLNGLEGSLSHEMLRFEQPAILGGGSGVMVKKEVLGRVGGFDQDVSPAEDWEFYYRCARVCKVGFVSEILVKYREHRSNAHLNIPRMEKALLNAFDKTFALDPELNGLRNTSYGKIHSVLAGSYFSAGMYPDCIRHVVKSIRYSPKQIRRYLAFPFRRLNRRLVATRKA